MGRAAARARPLLTAPSRYAGPIVPLKGKAYQKNFVASKAIVHCEKTLVSIVVNKKSAEGVILLHKSVFMTFIIFSVYCDCFPVSSPNPGDMIAE